MSWLPHRTRATSARDAELKGTTNDAGWYRHLSRRKSWRRKLEEFAVAVGGAEIDVDATDPVAGKRKELGVAEGLAVLGDAFLVYKGFFAFHEDPFQVASFDPQAAGPTTLEIGRLADLVIIGAGENEIVGQRILEGLAVGRRVGGEDRM